MASISKLSNGRYRARYYNDAGRQIAKHFVKKVDAQRWLDEIAASMVTGQYVDPRAGNVTFRQFYAGWSARQVWVSNTRVNADQAVSQLSFADLPLKNIRRSHVEVWIKQMSGRLAPTTIKVRVKIVRAVFIAAVRDRVIASDPSDGVVLPRPRRAEAAMTVPDPAVVQNVLESCSDEFRAYVAAAALAGLRRGEISGLQVDDIDFLRRTLTVTRQIQRTADGLEIRPPKYGSERVVFVPEALLAVLSEHIARHNPDGPPERWLFSSNGEPWDDNRVTYNWRVARKRAGAKTVRLHDLRHFYASGLIADGCDVVTVQRALGHSSATTTLNTYSHLWPSAEDRTRAAATRLAEAILAVREGASAKPN